ncbi:hypothetical protein ENBRE01_3087 [Enteropsectra breve]|nr:hypothetical protein ENBRE01_3087 [Enteropsectra breve]
MNGHPGISKMKSLFASKYYGIKSKEIQDFVSNCAACCRFNSLKTVQPIKFILSRAKYERYQMDCIDLQLFSRYFDNFPPNFDRPLPNFDNFSTDIDKNKYLKFMMDFINKKILKLNKKQE